MTDPRMSQRNKEFRQPSISQMFIVEGSYNVIGTTVAAPIARVKLLLQSQNEMIRHGRLQNRYNGVFNCIVRTFKSEGASAFWRGNLSQVLRFFPYISFTHQLSTNQDFKDLFKINKKPSKTETAVKSILGAVTVASLANAFVYPLDYIRVRLANDIVNENGTRQFKNMRAVLKHTAETEGIRGLYRGVVISCVGISAYHCVQFGLFASLGSLMSNEKFRERYYKLYPLPLVLPGLITYITMLITYPFNTIRNRMMMTSGTQLKYNGGIDCGLQIIKKEGVMALMKGAGTNIVFILTSSVIGVVIIEGSGIGSFG